MNVFLKEEIAAQYDSFYQNEQGKTIDRLEKNALKELIKNVTVNSNMLEMGCGTGHWTEFFLGLGFNIQACDISEAMLTIARKKNLQRANFRQANVLDLPFQNDSFDVVASIAMLEFTGNPIKAIAEMMRVLKKNGLLILGCINKNSTTGKRKHEDPVFKDAYFFSKEELIRVLTTYGSPQLIETVYLSDDFKILDETSEANSVEGVFLAVALKK